MISTYSCASTQLVASSSSTMRLGVVALGCLCLLAVVSAEVLFEEKFGGKQLLCRRRQGSQHF
jgi:hypothetical protein